MKRANNIDARAAVIIGEDERNNPPRPSGTSTPASSACPVDDLQSVSNNSCSEPMSDERTLSRLVVVGASHRTSSETTRDRLFISEEDLPGFLISLRKAGFTVWWRCPPVRGPRFSDLRRTKKWPAQAQSARWRHSADSMSMRWDRRRTITNRRGTPSSVSGFLAG